MRVMGSPIKSAQLRAAVAPSIFVNEQNASEAPKAHLLKRPKDQILGRLLLGGTTILHLSKPNHSSKIDQDDVVTEEVLKVAAGLACDLGQAVETSPEPACEANDTTRTNLYWVQTNGTTLGMTAKEAKALFGIHIVMGSLKLPQARMYWAAATRVSLIADAMPRDRFFRLRNALHVCNNDSDQDDNNRCWKVQLLLDRVRKACLKISRSQAACVDEQMVPFTGRTQLRQYVRGKPNPTGLKNFVLADRLGRVLDFEIYQGATTPIPSEHKNLGISGGNSCGLLKRCLFGRTACCVLTGFSRRCR
ncbi:hypothetical protein MRX96_044503 [Rhipicephalus microplus]